MKRKRSDYLRDMDRPTVLGYELDRATLTPVRNPIDTKKPGDFGASPNGDGTFTMIPSGDVVSYEERCKRLAARQ